MVIFKKQWQYLHVHVSAHNKNGRSYRLLMGLLFTQNLSISLLAVKIHMFETGEVLGFHKCGHASIIICIGTWPLTHPIVYE